MSYQTDRDAFLYVCGLESIPVHVARKLLATANKLQKLSELACSSEAADRDRVPCPGAKSGRECRCDMFCPDHKWDFARCLPYCARQHSTVPRYMVQEARIEHAVRDLCMPRQIVPVFHGDPRGAVLRLEVPSGRDKGWGGIAVPSRGFTAAEMERICR